MFCISCGKEMPGDAKFCPSCGNQPAQATNSQQQVPVSIVPANTVNAVPLAKKKVKYTTFLFVTSLVFMILFAIRFFSAIGTMSDWESIRDTSNLPVTVADTIPDILSTVQFCVVATTAAFAFVLVFFILIATLRGRKDSASNTKLAKTIFAFSIVVLVLGIVYMFSEIALVDSCKAFFDVAKDAASINQDTVAELKTQIDDSFRGAMVFNVTFIAFSIANIVKSIQLVKHIKEKENQLSK